MDPTYDAASSDATAICATLGTLAIMCMNAKDLAGSAAMLTRSKDVPTQESGRRLLDAAAHALKEARERIDTLMQEFGDYFNDGDACSETMTKLTEPVYEVLGKRKEGVSLDD